MTKRIGVGPGVDSIPTSTIPTDPQAFVTWFSSVYLKRWAANADVRNATPGTNVQIGGSINTPGSIDVNVGITGIVEGTGLTVTETSAGVVTVGLANTAVTPGSYTNTNLTVNAEGQLTAASNGSAGGVTEPFNITPDTHAILPTGVGIGPNDEFEAGTSIDITGGRYAGATAWTALNVGSGVTAISNSVTGGSLILQGGSTVVGSSTVKGYIQPLPAGQGTYVAKVSITGASPTVTFGGGIVLYESASTKCVVFNPLFNAGSPLILGQTFSSPTVSVSNLASVSISPNTSLSTNYPYILPMYLQVVVGATTIAFSFSLSGVPGTFQQLVSFTTTADFTVAPDHIGLSINPDAYGSSSTVLPPVAIFDWFRRIS